MRLFPAWRDATGVYSKSDLLIRLEKLIVDGSDLDIGAQAFRFGDQPKVPLPHWQQTQTLYYVRSGKLAIRIQKDNSTFFLGADCFYEGVLVLPKTPLWMRGVPGAEVIAICGDQEVDWVISPPAKGSLPPTSEEEAAMDRFVADTGGS